MRELDTAKRKGNSNSQKGAKALETARHDCPRDAALLPGLPCSQASTAGGPGTPLADNVGTLRLTPQG